MCDCFYLYFVFFYVSDTFLLEKKLSKSQQDLIERRL